MLGEANKRLAINCTTENRPNGWIRSEDHHQIQRRQSDRSDRRAFLAVSQSQAAAVGVDFSPVKIDDLAAPAPGQGDHARDPGCGRQLCIACCLPEDQSKLTILIL